MAGKKFHCMGMASYDFEEAGNASRHIRGTETSVLSFWVSGRTYSKDSRTGRRVPWWCLLMMRNERKEPWPGVLVDLVSKPSWGDDCTTGAGEKLMRRIQ